MLPAIARVQELNPAKLGILFKKEFDLCRVHLGWGLNPQALWYGIALNGDEPERSRAAARTFPGNFLFSTGPNNQGGGKRTTRGHYDVPMRDCTMALDGRLIIENGKIIDDNMVVERIIHT